LGNITIEALETEKAATDYTDQSMGVPPATIDGQYDGRELRSLPSY
jgi:hypothetical protein